MNRISGLFILVTMIFVASPAVAWQRPNGAPGDPAQDGGDGAAGESINWRSTGGPSQHQGNFYAGHGQHGGHGGTGVDGDDADSVAQGGNGGIGGAGGNVRAVMAYIPETTLQLILAGHGGAGGKGGASEGLPAGQGARGGDGGNIFQDLVATRSSDSEAFGGNGGVGFGFANRGGIGGTVESVLRLSASQSHPHQRLVATMNGGHGGNGFGWARGGHGGNVRLLDSLIQRSAPAHYFEFIGTGGHGGNSFGHNGGNGGRVDFQTPRFQDQAAAGSLSDSGNLRFRLAGGDGGDSTISYQRVGSGGRGGDVRWDPGSQSTTFLRSLTNFVFVLTGGEGGAIVDNGWQAQNAQNSRGGDGGSAIASGWNLDVRGAEAVGRGLSGSLELTGGDGGDNAIGQGGVGGVARVQNMQAQVDHGFLGSIRAYAGHGGDGLQAGDGGHAESIDGFTVFSEQGDVRLTSRTRGGNAGRSSGSQAQGGIGGIAKTVQSLTSPGDVWLEGFALAGLAPDGIAGGAHVEAYGDSTQSGAVQVYAEATLSDLVPADLPRVGSDAYSLGRARSVQGSANARAQAFAGKGSISSGSAMAHGIGLSEQGAATARATATTLRSTVWPTELATGFNQTTSIADARGQTSSLAVSNAQSDGHFTSALARGISQGASFEATLDATTQSIVHRGSSELIINGAADDSPVFTEAFSSYRLGYQAGTDTPHVRSAVFSAGDESTLEGIDAGNLTSQFDFQVGQYDLLATMEFQTRDSGNDFSLSTLMRGSATPDFARNLDYYLFVYDMESVAGGLDDMHVGLFSQDGAVLEQNYENGDAALADLQDWSTLVNIDPNDMGELFLRVTGTQRQGTSFRMRVGLAGLTPKIGTLSFNAVPEPGSCWLIGLMGIGYMLVARRRPER